MTDCDRFRFIIMNVPPHLATDEDMELVYDHAVTCPHCEEFMCSEDVKSRCQELSHGPQTD